MAELTKSTFFNVEATFNAWLSTTLASYTRPTWLPTMPAIILNWDDLTASTPCFAVHHHPVGIDNTYQGRAVGDGYTGRRAFGFVDVSCWVNRNNNPSWMAQLRTMRDMIASAVTASPSLQLYDYQTDPSTPTSLPFKVNINEVNEVPVLPDDDNPSMERARIIIGYSFVFRAS